MPCVFRACGKNFEVEVFLRKIKLNTYLVSRKGEPRRLTKPKGKKLLRSGFCCDASKKDFSDFQGQIQDAFNFLKANRAKLQKLVHFPGVEEVRLDFGIERKDVIVQCDYFPPEFLSLAGELGIGIEISQYPVFIKETSE